jgi:LPS-assembly lipoprotein
MSWLERWTAYARFAGLLSVLALGGCFHPLYAPASGRDVQGELAAIQVAPIPDRLGHYLANELIFAFNGTGSQVTPKYRLVVATRERVETPLVDTISGNATSGTVVVDAEYKLLPILGGDPVTQGTAFTIASYDRSNQRFANIRAARDAEIRDAKTLADQIRTRVAAAIATKS